MQQLKEKMWDVELPSRTLFKLVRFCHFWRKLPFDEFNVEKEKAGEI